MKTQALVLWLVTVFWDERLVFLDIACSALQAGLEQPPMSDACIVLKLEQIPLEEGDGGYDGVPGGKGGEP